jgi:murein DD-endopeptidase MepM/ murein hydrolase activator NlpD
MLDFLRTLFANRSKQVSVVLWEEDSAEDPKAFNIFPKNLFLVAGMTGFSIVLITIILFRFTPLGLIILNYEEFTLRNEVLEVTQRVIALQDSLERREAQLKGIQDVIINRVDTSFQVGLTRDFQGIQPLQADEIQNTTTVTANDFLEIMELNFETVSVENPGFPTEPPTKGTITKNFDLINRHLGIDIAATSGEPVKVVADGVVLNADWTLNYGFVVIVQHTRGYVTIYKHTQSPLVEVGDFVQKGAILSSVSSSGLISSGSHLHFEVWLNGQPVDPQNYLID